jgi:hypothetical protein
MATQPNQPGQQPDKGKDDKGQDQQRQDPNKQR